MSAFEIGESLEFEARAATSMAWQHGANSWRRWAQCAGCCTCILYHTACTIFYIYFIAELRTLIMGVLMFFEPLMISLMRGTPWGERRDVADLCADAASSSTAAAAPLQQQRSPCRNRHTETPHAELGAIAICLCSSRSDEGICLIVPA